MGKKVRGDEFVFRPYPQNKTTRHPEAVRVSFQPLSSDDSHLGRPVSIVPTFNPDGRYYTACFVVPAEERSSEQDEIRNFSERLIDLGDIDEAEIEVAKPKSRQRYCAVCRRHYEDYLQHIECFEHKAALRACPFTRDIQRLSWGITSGKILSTRTRATKKRFDTQCQKMKVNSKPMEIPAVDLSRMVQRKIADFVTKSETKRESISDRQNLGV